MKAMMVTSVNKLPRQWFPLFTETDISCIPSPSSQSSFLNCIIFADRRILRLRNCEIFGQVCNDNSSSCMFRKQSRFAINTTNRAKKQDISSLFFQCYFIYGSTAAVPAAAAPVGILPQSVFIKVCKPKGESIMSVFKRTCVRA